MEIEKEIKSIARTLLFDMNRITDNLITDLKNRSGPEIPLSDITIIEDWKNKTFNLTHNLDEKSTNQLLKYYSKISDLQKRQNEYIDYVESIKEDFKDGDIATDKNIQRMREGFKYHIDLLCEIETDQLLIYLNKLAS